LRLLEKLKRKRKPEEVNPFTGEVVTPEPVDYSKVNLKISTRINQEIVSRRVVKTLGYLMLIYNGIMTTGYLLSGNIPFTILFGFTTYFVLGYLKYANREDANR
jgi:hypothetical protein